MCQKVSSSSDVGLSQSSLRQEKSRSNHTEDSHNLFSSVKNGNGIVWSSGVAFRPQGRYWRIGGLWYDFTTFNHPGGQEMLYLSRDRFDDATFAFESHHLNYKKARAIIKKYKLSEEIQQRLNKEYTIPAPKLLPDESFYSDLRRRVVEYFKRNNLPLSGEPTTECMVLFTMVLSAWCLSLFNSLYYNPCISSAILHAVISCFLGGFGHNFVHQPKYRILAYISLDFMGFSSDVWQREHCLQHHMYTNTPKDHHFRVTDPFLLTDPTVPRNWIQSRIMPYINPLILFCGVYGNWFVHFNEMVKGNEKARMWPIFLPMMVGSFCYLHGWWGLFLVTVQSGCTGVYFYTMALMNHNAEKALDVKKRNACKDWGAAQVICCADWCIDSSFIGTIPHLGLNYHTVHHLFPSVDFSHFPSIQKIMMQTCVDHDIEYEDVELWNLYGQMVKSFATATSLFMEVITYNGA